MLDNLEQILDLTGNSENAGVLYIHDAGVEEYVTMTDPSISKILVYAPSIYLNLAGDKKLNKVSHVELHAPHCKFGLRNAHPDTIIASKGSFEIKLLISTDGRDLVETLAVEKKKD